MKSNIQYAIYVSFALLTFSACQKEISFGITGLPGTSGGSAVFSFSGTAGNNCTNFLVNGIYKVGVASDTSNYISVQVSVDSVGTYTVSTNSSNGIQFSGAGIFTTTGLQNIKLLASGTPVAAGSSTVMPGTGTCSVSITTISNVLPPVSSVNCKDCSYLPTCVGSMYAYFDTTSGIASLRMADLLTGVDTTINGKTYVKLTSQSGASYFNCTNGETNVIGYQLTSASGTSVLQKYESTILKANAAVGEKWADTLVNPLGQTVIQNFTMAAKGVSRKVGSFSFSDVIVINLETGVDVPIFGYLPYVNSVYYYAKGIGLVETTSDDINTGTPIYHSVVKSYFVP